jgi:hypothetical protein
MGPSEGPVDPLKNRPTPRGQGPRPRSERLGTTMVGVRTRHGPA